MSLSGKVGAVYIRTEDDSISFSDEETSANDTYKRYIISDSDKSYWDSDFDVTVKVNGSLVSSGYSIEHCGAVVVFETALDPLDTVTVSGKYFTIIQHGGFFNWTLELEMDNADITTFQSEGWKESIPTIKGFSIAVESYWGDDKFFSSLGDKVLVVLYVDSGPSQKRYEGWGLISSDDIDTSVDDVINESIEFKGTDSLYYRED